MKMEFKKKMALTFAAIGLSVLSHAQTGIGTFTPDKSARLDIYSDKTGFLMPRVALVKTIQQSPVTAPATSLMVYNTATSNDVTPGYYYWDGQKWSRIAKSDELTFNNGLTAANGNVQLGGALTKPSVLTTTAASTLAIKGLQTGAVSDNVLVADANGVLKYVTRASLGGGADNLGNHIATLDLNMSSKNILNIYNGYFKNEAQILDRVTTNTNYFGIYKNNGLFGIWNNMKSSNALTIDETTNKTTLASAQITKGTDGSTPTPGAIATAGDINGNIIWTTPQTVAGAIAGVYEFLGTNQVDIPANTTTLVPMNGNAFKLNKSGKVLITYSLLPLPTGAGKPVQGSIDLVVDGTKTISSYYSANDAPTSLVSLGNYSTAQKIMSLPAGNHTIGLNVKSWYNTTRTNVNPYPSYAGSTSNDTQAMVARITVIIFND